MRALRRERHLVFIDQRGTGDSNPLSCAAVREQSLRQSLSHEIFDLQAIRSCRRSLEKKADLKLYTTAIAIEDIDEIRGALGYDKINLYAVSYGTVGALEYLRRHSDHVRAAVLAGAVLPLAKPPLHFARGAERAMDKLIAACAADESCRSSFPRLKEDLAAALSGFADGPVRLEISPHEGEIKEPLVLSRGVFVERLRSMLYNHSSARLLPLLIHRAARGDWLTFVKAAAGPASAPAHVPTLGAYLTVTCSESVAFIEPEEIAAQTERTFLGDYRIRRHQAACAEWPRGDVPTDFFLPVKAPTPVLLLSGDADPAAPPEFGALISRSLPKGRLVVLSNTLHDYSSDCARRLTADFIGQPSAESLDGSCAEEIRRPPFYTELPERYR